MRHVTRLRQSPVVLGALALSAGTGVAIYAAIPANNVISACYASGGVLRVIDRAVGQCRTGETLLEWNVQGPIGPMGPQGPPGPKGEMVFRA